MNKEAILERISELADMARNGGRSLLGTALEELHHDIDNKLVDMEPAD